MGSFKERIFGLKGLFSLGATDIVGNVISMFFWLYIATIIDVEQYGQVNYLIGIAAISSTVVLIGNSNVITVFSAKKIPLQSSLYLLTLFAGTISAISVFIIFYNIEVSLLIFGYLFGTMILAELIGRKLFVGYSKYLLTQKILTVAFGLGLYHIIGINGIILGLAISYAPFLIRLVNEFRATKIDFSLLKPHRNFIVTNYTFVVIDGFKNSLDKLIIVPLLGFTVLGQYTLSLQIISVLMMSSNIVFKYILSEDASGNRNKKLKLVTIFFATIIAVAGIFILPLMIPIFFPKYVEAIPALKIMSLGIISSTISLTYYSKLFSTEKSRVLIISRSLMVLSMILGIVILGQQFGLVGVAYSFVLSSSIEAVFLFITSRRMKDNNE